MLIWLYDRYAFEALCTQPEDTLAGSTDTPLPTLDRWKCVVRRTFGDLNVVFSAEVDCVEGKDTGTRLLYSTYSTLSNEY